MEASKAAKPMRWAGRIIGLLSVVSILLALFFLALALSWTMASVDWTPLFMMAIITLFALAGCIVSWWRVQLAGILIVSVSIVLGISWGLSLKPYEYQYLIYIVVFDLPLFIAGALFLSSWWLSKRIR